jgi:hypothetical protein
MMTMMTLTMIDWDINLWRRFYTPVEEPYKYIMLLGTA